MKMYESRRIDFEFDSKGQDSQFDSRSNLTFDRFESFKSSSNVIASQFFFFLASKETLSASRYRRTSRKKKTNSTFLHGGLAADREGMR